MIQKFSLSKTENRHSNNTKSDSVFNLRWLYLVIKVISHAVLYFILLFLAEARLENGDTHSNHTCRTCNVLPFTASSSDLFF